MAICEGAAQAKLAEKDSQIQDLVQQLSELLDASNSLKSQNSMLTRMLKLSPKCCTEQQQPPDQHPSAPKQQQPLQPQVSAGLTASLAQRGPTGTRSNPTGTSWQGDKHAEGLTLTVKGAQPIQLTADQVGEKCLACCASWPLQRLQSFCIVIQALTTDVDLRVCPHGLCWT